MKNLVPVGEYRIAADDILWYRKWDEPQVVTTGPWWRRRVTVTPAARLKVETPAARFEVDFPTAAARDLALAALDAACGIAPANQQAQQQKGADDGAQNV